MGSTSGLLEVVALERVGKMDYDYLKVARENMERDDHLYLKIAMEEAEKAFHEKTYPIGAVIVGPEGEIWRDHNHVYSDDDFTSHAEIKVIQKASRFLMQEAFYQKCTLYTTLEPCFMCCGALLHARIARVVWIKNDDVHGAIRYLKKKTDFHDQLLQRFSSLQTFYADIPEFEREMDSWMEEWNAKKKDILEVKRCCDFKADYTSHDIVGAINS